MKPELFIKAQNLWRRMGAAGERVFARATDESDDPAKRRKLVLLAGVAILAGIAVIFVLSRLGGDDAAPAPVETRQAVSAIAIETHSFQPIVSLNGEARPKRDLRVTAPATGVRILELLVDEGDNVRTGQAMARLDTALSNAQTRAAQASVAEAQSESVRARGEYQRAESIRDSGALSTEAIEQRRAAATAADARLAAARAQLAEVNARLGGGYVRAPASGLVIDRTAEIGRPVEGQVLFRIAAGNALEVSAQVAESDILALAPGQRATFRLVDGSTVEGRLSRLPASIDPRTRTGEALFDLPSGSRVRAGMFLRGEAQLPVRDVLAAPQNAVLYESGAAYVFVLDAQGVVHRAPVTLGARDGDWVEVVSGLEPGQRIVGAGAAFLRDGETVRVLTPPAPSAAPAPTPEQARGSDQLRGRAAKGG